jgi:protein-tyrosine kinase
MAIDLIQRAAERLRLKEGLGSWEKPGTSTLSPNKDQGEGTFPAEGTEPETDRHRPAMHPLTPVRDQVASIDLGRLQIAGFVTPTGGRARISDEFRVIKRPLLLRAFATGPDRIENGNLLMVTSAQPGEGKTFSAINLAMSMASERDLHVLLIDGDVQRPSLFQTLGVEPQRGLLDVLSSSDLTVGDVLLRTNIRNLTLMASGTHTQEATELLASQKMAVLMKEISTRYKDRIVIIDTPPVLASTEPSVLALHVGQTVLVIEAGKTGRQALEQTLNLISTCPSISLLFNKSEKLRFAKTDYHPAGYY